MPYTSYQVNANQKIADKTGVSFEDIITVGIDYEIDGGDVIIYDAYLQKGNIIGGQDITDCLDQDDLEYFEERILEEDGEWKL